jgi:hypothetical protein
VLAIAPAATARLAVLHAVSCQHAVWSGSRGVQRDSAWICRLKLARTWSRRPSLSGNVQPFMGCKQHAVVSATYLLSVCDRQVSQHEGQEDATRPKFASDVHRATTAVLSRLNTQPANLCVAALQGFADNLQRPLALTLSSLTLQAGAACNTTPRGAPPAFLQPLAAVVQRCVDLNAAACPAVRRRCSTGPALAAVHAGYLAVRQVATPATPLPQCIP